MHRLSLSAPPPRHELDPLRRRPPPVAVNRSGGQLPRVPGLPRSSASPSSASSPDSDVSSRSSVPPPPVGADRGPDRFQSPASIGDPTPLRRFLSADGEREAVEVLREQFAHEKRITSDDVRYVVRVIASRGGRVALPADFPPARWIFEFKRRCGFAAYAGAAHSAAASALAAAAGAAHSALPAPTLLARRPRDDRSSSERGSGRSASVIARVTNSSGGSSDGSDGDAERDAENMSYSSMDIPGAPSRRRRRYGYGYGYEFGGAESAKTRYAVPTAYYDEDEDECAQPNDLGAEMKTAASKDTPAHASSAQPPLPQQQPTRHTQQQQQQQQFVPSLNAIVDRRGLPWPAPVPPSVQTNRSDPGTSNNSETSMSRGSNGSTGTSNGSSSRAPAFGAASWGSGSGPVTVAARILAGPLAKSALPSMISKGSTSIYSLQDDEQSMSSTSSTTEKRKYKLSHTVSPEIWEKAIAAVEQQGMSLRAAAKIYGVHFAALHRRVKKRAANGHAAKGTQGYFHPSDEAGIMRVVVARAELGVLMTFDELMELVETAALRKLPDISVEAARALMSRFQSRNEQSIRHIIVDWPLPRVAQHVGPRLPPSPALRTLPAADSNIPVPAETTVPV